MQTYVCLLHSLIQNDSVICMTGSLCEQGTSFCTEIIIENSEESYFMYLTGFTSFVVWHMFPLSTTAPIFVHRF